MSEGLLCLKQSEPTLSEATLYETTHETTRYEAILHEATMCEATLYEPKLCEATLYKVHANSVKNIFKTFQKLF